MPEDQQDELVQAIDALTEAQTKLATVDLTLGALATSSEEDIVVSKLAMDGLWQLQHTALDQVTCALGSLLGLERQAGSS